MKPQTGMFRGEAKKEKPTKMDKVYDYFAKLKRRNEANKKKEQTS